MLGQLWGKATPEVIPVKIPALSDTGPVWLDIDRILALTTSDDKVYFVNSKGVYEAPRNLKQWANVLQQQQSELITASRSAYVRPDLALKYDKKTNTLAFDTNRGLHLIKVSRSNREKVYSLF